jgi:hypothetical protein
MTTTSSTNNNTSTTILQCAACRNIVGDTRRERDEGTYVVDRVSSLVRVYGDKVTCGECHTQLGTWSHGKFFLHFSKISTYKLTESHHTCISKKEFDEYKEHVRSEMTNMKDVILSLASYLTNTKPPSSSDVYS